MGRVWRVDGDHRLQVLVMAITAGQPVLRVELHVYFGATLLEAVLRIHVQVDVRTGRRERTVGAAERERLWVSLVLVIREEVNAILHNRPAEGAADLRVL